jgi:hypothetical protein
MHVRHRIRQARLAVCLGGAVLAVATVLAPSASADGYGGVTASCSTTPAACTVSAQNPGERGSGSIGSAARTDGGQTSVSPPPVVTCTDAPFAITPQNAAAMQAAQPPAPGHWVVRTCSGPVLMPIRILTWIRGGAPVLPDPRVLAAQALSKLTLPTPVIESSPGGGAPQTVELPTWAWLPKNQWAPLSATASVPGESVTATATPISVTWSWGDGSTTVCRSAGTPYVNGVSNPAAASPDCGHTYHQTSAAAANQQFTVTATLAWSVAWSGGGQGGTFPNLTTTATAHWTVRQIQSLIVNQ